MIYEYFDIPKPNVVLVQSVVTALALSSATLTNVQWDEVSKTGELGTTRRLRIVFNNELNSLDKRTLDEAIEPFGYDIPIGHYTEKTALAGNDEFLVQESSLGEEDPKYLKKRVKLSTLIFGASNRVHRGAESSAESSTSSSSYQEKMRLTFTPPRTGWYEITFSARMSCNSANKLIGYRLQVDNTTTKKEGNVYNALTKAGGLYTIVGGNILHEFADTNEHFFDLDYKSNGSNTAYIDSAVITAREIGASL